MLNWDNSAGLGTIFARSIYRRSLELQHPQISLLAKAIRGRRDHAPGVKFALALILRQLSHVATPRVAVDVHRQSREVWGTQNGYA
jgi:hypothetical protein